MVHSMYMEKIMKKILISLAVILLGTTAFALEKERVTLSFVQDGDTIQVINVNNQKESIRLIGIDSFETSKINRAYKQAYLNKMDIEDVVVKGIKQKQALKKLFEENKDKQLYFERHGIDRYNRILGVIYLDKLNVNNYMLKSGNALKYIYKKIY